MKRFITVLGALAVAGMAHAAQPQANTQDETVPGAGNIAAPQGETTKPEPGDRNCLHYTGTRIASRSGPRSAAGKTQRPCSNGTIGRSYTREDIDRTGEIDIADALRKLDPSIH